MKDSSQRRHDIGAPQSRVQQAKLSIQNQTPSPLGAVQDRVAFHPSGRAQDEAAGCVGPKAPRQTYHGRASGPP